MRFIKKIMVLALLLSSFVNVSMKEVKAEELTGSFGDNMNYHLDTESGVLTISGNGPMPDFEDYSDAPWADQTSIVTAINIEEGVTHIGDGCFSGMDILTSVSIAESVRSIGSSAFEYCESLSTIALPSGLTSIGEGAFLGCGLTSIVLPYGITRIEAKTFSYCRDLETLIIPSSVTSVGNAAFNKVPVVTVYCDNTCISADNRYGATSVATIHYETPEYRWTEDLLSVTGKVCVIEDEHELIVETVQTEKLTDNGPTCEEDGYYEYVAEFESDKLETQRKSVPAEAIGHEYVFTEIVWTEYTAQAVYTCTHDETHVQRHDCDVTSEVTKEATCEEAGTRLHTATYDGHTSTKEETIPAKGHDWNDTVYTWAEDNSTVTATRTCKNDPEHVETETVNTTSQPVAPTCEEAGKIIYTSAEFENEAFTVQTKTVDGEPATGHKWGEPAYLWADDNSTVTATRVCENDPEHVESETADTTRTVTDPTCEEAGTVTYEAVFENEAFTKQTKTVDGAEATGHDWNDPVYVWAENNSSVTATRTCKNNPEHVETETVNTTSQPVAPTCEEAGKIIYTSAEFENEAFTVQTKTVDGEPATGHDWNAPEYTWAEDYSSVTATRSCKNDPEHVESETVATTSTTIAPTCEEAGKIIYTSAEFENEAFTVQTTTADGAAATGHDWNDPVYTWAEDNSSVTATRTCKNDTEHVESETAETTYTVTEPTCTEAGIITYEAVFENEAFTKQTKEVEGDPATGHQWGEPTYEWSEDNLSVTATAVCTRDATHVETETVNTTVTETATCEEAGQRIYTAEFENELFTTQTKSEAMDALGHDWSDVTYTWADDNSTVTATRTCKNDPSHIETETVNTSSVTVEPTCENAGTVTYTAEFENEAFESQTKTVTGEPALGHDWGIPTYQWSDDNTSVTATRVCGHNSEHVESETVAVTSETVEPTCEEAGKIIYTSAEFENEAFEVQTRELPGDPAIGHEWGDVTYTWAEDNSTVTATRTCTHNAEHVQSETVAVTSQTIAPTCEEAGKIIYTSAEFENEAFEVQTKTVDGEPATGHQWSEPTYEWSDDYLSVTATRICEHDPEHVETETVGTTKTVVDPTCEEAGKIIYTAEFENAAFGTKTKELPGDPATGHAWGEVTYTWSEDNSTVTATRVCENDPEHTESETVSTTSVTIEPTCEEAGKIIYTSAEFENEAFEVQTKTVDGEPATGHQWGAPTYQWSEDNTSVTATRVCTNDSEHVETETATVNVTVVDPTCETAGKTVYTAEFENEAFETQTKELPGDPALGHDWGTPTYEWSEDNLSVTATVVCQRDASHVITETVNTTVQETATCEEAGERIYTAEFENELFTTQTKSEAMDALGHKWGDPTYEWSDDNTTVTATRVCEHDSEHKETETVTATVTVVDPTCEEAGKTVYTAEFENEAFAKQTKEIPGDPALGHDWGTPTYQWSEDNSSVTATRVCGHNGEHKETETVDTTRTVVDPTCEEAGKIIYTAEFENAAFETQTIELPGDPATGHEWGDVTYTWADDNSTVTATRTCTHNAEHVQSETVAVTSETVPATCEEAGKIIYTSAEFENEAFEVQTKEVEGDPALGHDWGTPTYEWLEDNSTVIATRVCGHNSEHKETETVTTTRTVVDPTCEEAGSITYEAVFENEAFVKQTKTVEGAAATGHEYEFTRIEWTGYTAKAVYTCKHDASHTVQYDCEVTSEVTKQATCEVAGTRVYTAKYDGHTATTTESIPALGHSFTHYVSNNDADFDHDGTKTAHCDRGCGATDTVTDAGTRWVVKSIEMSSMPKKTEYALNEPIDLTGAKIKTTLTNGRTMVMDVTKDMVSGFNSSKEGTCTVTVTFRGKTTTFKVTVKPGYLRGDFNKDKKVTDADAIYLLMSTFFSSEYPLNQPGDFNADRKVTDADAIYLLMYTFFPSEYPLN